MNRIQSAGFGLNNQSCEGGSHECAGDADADIEYNMPMHVASIFIVMAASFFGTLLPIIGKRFWNTRLGQTTLEILKLFGAGVILSTAFVHMFTSADEAFTDPRLNGVITYRSLAAVLAIVGIYTTHLIQLITGQIIGAKNAALQSSLPSSSVTVTSDQNVDLEHTIPHADPTQTNSIEAKESIQNHAQAAIQDIRQNHGHSECAATSILASKSESTTEAQLIVYLLELGIASHSVIIGMDLGIAEDAEFSTILIALAFHQFFEGIALSAIVAEANFKRASATIFMVVFYSFTTPIGIAIGILMHSSLAYSQMHRLMAIGVLNSLSAGILGYDGIVNVMVPHFRGRVFEQASTAYKTIQLLCLYLGTLTMSVIGIWT